MHPMVSRVKTKLKSWLERPPATSPLSTEPKTQPAAAVTPYLHDETAETYRARLIDEIVATVTDAKEAHDLILAEIHAVADHEERQHSLLHEVRHLLTYSMVPAGPGSLLDIGGPTLAQRPLNELKKWNVKTLPILRIDYESARFPFEDESQDGVLLCEVIEHFITDPLHCLIEINRILKPGGFLVVTTPNTASWFAIYQALQHRHPNRWPVYGGPDPGRHHHIHAREYLVSELVQLLKAAGFESQTVYTRDYGIDAQHRPIPGFSEKDRGETIFCHSIKTGRPSHRQITPLYLENIPFHE